MPPVAAGRGWKSEPAQPQSVVDAGFDELRNRFLLYEFFPQAPDAFPVVRSQPAQDAKHFCHPLGELLIPLLRGVQKPVFVARIVFSAPKLIFCASSADKSSLPRHSLMLPAPAGRSSIVSKSVVIRPVRSLPINQDCPGAHVVDASDLDLFFMVLHPLPRMPLSGAKGANPSRDAAQVRV
jgi:hypothetical protein